MTEEYNPFQSPESLPPSHSYLVPDVIVRRRGPFASGHVRAVLSMLALGVVALCDIGSIYFDCLHYRMIVRVQRGEMSYGFDLTNEGFTRFTQFKLVAEIVAIFSYLFWIHRAYRNLPALGNPVPSATPGWAVGSYFVPVVNLFIPYTIMAEIWRYSDPAQLGVIRKTTSRIVGAWWAMFLGPVVPVAGMLFSLLLTPSRRLFDEIAIEAFWSIGVPIVNLIAAILAIVLVFSIDKNQHISHDLIEAQSETVASSRKAE